MQNASPGQTVKKVLRFFFILISLVQDNLKGAECVFLSNRDGNLEIIQIIKNKKA